MTAKPSNAVGARHRRTCFYLTGHSGTARGPVRQPALFDVQQPAKVKRSFSER
jgi:hypothetical protein